MTLTPSAPLANPAWSRFTLLCVCALAVSVSLGTALVSLSKALVLFAFLGQLWAHGYRASLEWLRNTPKTIWVIGAAISWLALTLIWTEAATLGDAFTVLYGHARLLWLAIAFYLIATPKRAWVVLVCLMAGQVFVVILSWLLWLGLPLSWITSKYPPELGIAFTSTLEQPVMETLLVVFIWGFKDRLLKELLPLKFGKYILYGFILITIINVFFIMTGRTGYLVMVAFLLLVLMKALPNRMKILIIVLPVLVLSMLFQISDRFQNRVVQVKEDITQYKQGNVNTSQGIRLDNWRVSLQGIQESPWLGHGVGSFATVYKAQQGHENRVVRDPHQQYLFWWVEGGIIAFALLLIFFGTLLKDSMSLSAPANWALVCTTVIAAVMSLANCPLFGAGIGEFFFVAIAVLLSMPSSTKADKKISS